MTTPRLHVTEVLDEILRLFETDLKTTMSLKIVERGQIEYLPTKGIADLCNGIWLNIEPSIDFEPSEFPTNFLTTYPIRILFLMNIGTNTNVLKLKEAAIKQIIEEIFDNYQLSALTLTNGQVLWWLPKEVEMEPPEDGYVAEVAADIVAVAVRTECQVRTRR